MKEKRTIDLQQKFDKKKNPENIKTVAQQWAGKYIT